MFHMFSPAPTGFNRVLLWFPTTHTWLSLFSFGLVFLSLVFLPTIEDLARIGGKHNWLDAAADSSIAISRLLALPPFKPTHEPTHIFPSSPPPLPTVCKLYAKHGVRYLCMARRVCAFVFVAQSVDRRSFFCSLSFGRSRRVAARSFS